VEYFYRHKICLEVELILKCVVNFWLIIGVNGHSSRVHEYYIGWYSTVNTYYFESINILKNVSIMQLYNILHY